MCTYVTDNIHVFVIEYIYSYHCWCLQIMFAVGRYLPELFFLSFNVYIHVLKFIGSLHERPVLKYFCSVVKMIDTTCILWQDY